MVYFTEKLIREIRDRSCIWDTADMNHLNKEVLANMWTEIAENLYSDWHALSAFDQRDRVADIKKKWTNIKDSFVKDVKGNKPRKSQGPPEHRKKYYLFDHLQFLIPFIQDNANKSAADGTKSKKMRKSCVQQQQQQAEGSSSRMSHGTTVPPPEMPADVQRHVGALNGTAGSGSAADALCQLDGDMSFMVSLLPTVKSLDEKQRINFKIGVLQLLARIKFDEVVQMQQQHLPGTADATAAAVAYQPFVASDLRCFPVPYQPNLPFPFVGHPHQAAVSSTQQRRHHVNRTTVATKQEWSPEQASTYSDTDDAEADDGGDGESDDNN